MAAAAQVAGQPKFNKLLCPPIHAGLWLACWSCTKAFQLMLSFVHLLFGKHQAPPPQRLPSPSAATAAELVEKLPRVTLPASLCSGQTTITFAPCSNLCIYLFGVASCIARAKNFADAEPHLRYGGCSSGSLVAAVIALGADVTALFEECQKMLGAINIRRGGWIGAYSEAIATVVQKAAKGKDVSKVTANRRLQVGATILTPSPALHEISSFSSQQELEDAVLASCYIPVVWERTPWLRDLGFCIDGGASGFLVDGDIVVSPYHSHVADIMPRVEYPRELVFQPIDSKDQLRLFEDGYRDCMRWIESGCPSCANQRREEHGKTTQTWAIVKEGWDTFLEVTGLRNKPSKKEA